MTMRRLGISLIAIGLIALILALIIGGIGPDGATQGRSGDYEHQGKVILELQGNSWPTSLESHPVQGTDGETLQEYKFKQVREGEDFHYLVGGLQGEVYDLELSFVEYLHVTPGQRVFDVYCNGSPLPGLTGLDVLSRAGESRAYQVTVEGVAAPRGLLDLHFKATTGLAMVSYMRLLTPHGAALDINVWESRHWTHVPIRFEGREVYEVVLGRFGSRFMVNPMPQILAWRQSPLGTWTEDFSELLLAFRDRDGDIRCLPFTDRYTVFSCIEQELRLTGVSFECRDPALPFELTVSITSPFYPQDIKMSTAPFFYLEVKISNALDSEVPGELLLARPHKDDNFGEEAPTALGGGLNGYTFISRYSFGQDSHMMGSDRERYDDFWEAIAVDEAEGIEWHYRDITSTSWIWDSPHGYPLPCSQALYTFIPRGYSGFEMPFTLAPSGSLSRTVVLACHGSGGILNVLGEEDYAFIYGKPSPGPDLASVEEVVDYALGPERAAIEQKIAFFDGILSDAYISGLSQPGKDLMAYALQSFLCNTWWCYKASEPDKEWFSVWEGEPHMYHSSVDVEYNNAWFYLYFWPDMQRKLLEEWPIFEKENLQGGYLAHDTGFEHWINGMAYPHDMPVEENADYILLMYGYWKSTGDDTFMKSEFGHVRDYARFIFNCDTDGDGMPDINMANTIDQGSAAIQNSRNQTYLGVKALAAYRAAAEMAGAQGSPDQNFIKQCEERVRLLNTTLEDRVWLGDHFAVCTDYSVPAADREAYSIYASNGLLYLLASGLDTGVTASNLDRFRTDITAAAEATSRRYGYVHTSVNNENQWVSQNLWRDALGYWLEVGEWGEEQEDRYAGYWDLERYYATKKSGGFWDACAYSHERETREGVMRGAFPPDYNYDQSLGYYCRGVAALSLLEAPARLRLDRPSGILTFKPAYFPCRLPVLRCADWGAEDPGKRIPVLIFNDQGRLVEVLNPHLLP